MLTKSERPGTAVALRRLRLALLATVVLGGVVLSACNRGFTETEANGYRTLTIENALSSYSFEYPTYYEREGPYDNLGFRIPSIYVTLLAPRNAWG